MIIQLYRRTSTQNAKTDTDTDGYLWEPVEGEHIRLSTGRSGLRYGDTLVVPKPVLTDRLGQRRPIIITALLLPDLWATFALSDTPAVKAGVVYQVLAIQVVGDREHTYMVTGLDGKTFAIHSTVATYTWEFDEGDHG